MNISTSSPTPSVGQNLAARANKDMHAPAVRTIHDQNRIGLHYNDRVTVECQDSNERLVAQVARNAYGATENAYSAYGVLDASFDHIQAGVAGASTGRTLGRVGVDSVFNDSIRTITDQNRVGLVFTRAIRDNSEVSEQRTIAETVLKAYDAAERNGGALGVLAAGLNATAAGIGGPIGPALAQVGMKAIYNTHIDTLPDQCRIAVEFVKSVGRNDDSQTNEANAALRLYNQASNWSLGLDHLTDFLKSVKPAPAPSR